MKKVLIKIENYLYHYKGGKRINGVHKDISGDVNGIYGDVSDIRGNVSNIRGNVSGITGDLDECEITQEDRKKGIDISELVN